VIGDRYSLRDPEKRTETLSWATLHLDEGTETDHCEQLVVPFVSQ